MALALKSAAAMVTAVIGLGKIVSGDGQTVEKELYVSDFNCD